MNKKLRLRITNAISSTFNSCKPKHTTTTTTTTTNPAQVFYLSPSNPKIPDIEFPTPPPPPRPSPSRRLSSVLVSTAGCKSCAPAHSPRWEEDMDDLSRARSTPGYLWRKEEKWLAVTSVATADGFQMFHRRPKIDCPNDVDHDDDDDQFDDALSSNVLKLASRRRREIEMRRRAQIRGRKSKSKSRNSTSSMASTGTWFSSGEDDEREEEELYYEEEEEEEEGEDTDTLLSSRSFSGDSSRIKTRTVSSGCATAMLSKLCGGDEGKVKESFAVVKKSEDPRGDFRRSMAEMVVEKGIYEAADLEHLLHCFLSLNHKQHHGAIVSAFADIWEALFPQSSPHFSCDMYKL